MNRTVPAVPRGVKGSPTKAERERILDLTAKLLVATVSDHMAFFTFMREKKRSWSVPGYLHSFNLVIVFLGC